MATPEEEIVIIAEDDVAEFDLVDTEQDSTNLNEEGNKGKKSILIILAIVIFALILGIILLNIFKTPPETDSFSIDNIEEKLIENKQKPIEPSKI